jgi:branched-subunit amino acid transport protein AzlD
VSDQIDKITAGKRRWPIWAIALASVVVGIILNRLLLQLVWPALSENTPSKLTGMLIGFAIMGLLFVSGLVASKRRGGTDVSEDFK